MIELRKTKYLMKHILVGLQETDEGKDIKNKTEEETSHAGT